uniref:KA1 domain-containing protein n=1 Tax=Acrobeloides nanus TaxID=290746 RepID=A0A914D018_9BILA
MLQKKDSEDDYAQVEKKSRPKSVVYLDPGDIAPKPKLKAKTKSTKSVSSRDTSASDRSNYAMEEDLQCLNEENSLLRNEIQVLKTRNNRLIDQLREKSMQLSRLQGKSNEVETQLEALLKKSQLNEALDRLCLNERLTIGSRAVMETVEERLREFEEKLQNIKSEALKNQQLTINSTIREQNTYQACLEQVERLQRENFSILQLNTTELASQDKFIRQKLDLMPSYDALYSFTMGIVRKLGQLRNSHIEKSNQVIQAELELMHAQSSLMIAHAQIERFRIQLKLMQKQHMRRPISYHGEDLLENLVKPELNFYLPLQLHGSKTEHQRKCKNSNLDNLVESNEQNIETEFLRLFDYARCLSKICEDHPPSRSKPLERAEHQVIIYRNGRSTVSPTNSPLMENKHQSSNPQNFPMKNVRLVGLKEKESASRRPISLVETKERPFSGNIRRFGEHFNKVNAEDLASQTSNIK